MMAWRLLLTGLLLLLIGCDVPDKTVSERQKFQQQTESQLADFDQKIQDAKDRSGEVSGNAKARVEESIADLEERRVTLASKLDDMKAAGDEEWEAFKTDIQETSEELEQAFGDLQEGLEEALSDIN